MLVILVVGWAVNAICLGHMWLRARGSVVRKLLYSVPQVIPIFGALVYGGLYQPPQIHGESPRHPRHGDRLRNV
jgi:hypothetical protein